MKDNLWYNPNRTEVNFVLEATPCKLTVKTTFEFDKLFVLLKCLGTLKATKLLFQIKVIQAGPLTSMTFISVL